MRIITADDEPLALESLTEAVKEAVPEEEIHEFSNPEKLLEFAGSTLCDVAFLDIDMGFMSGIEVAKKLKIWNPAINIIFVTAYSEYMYTAIKMRVSGYLTKPVTREEVKEELENLRNPVRMPAEHRLQAKCFGTFDVFVEGKSLSFERSKTKELLAYLIDRRGNAVTSGEIRAVLWENAPNDKTTGTYLQILKKDLVSALKREGVEDVLKLSWNKYAIDSGKISCDYYDYLDDKPEGVHAYNGEYMSQYSWGELANAILQDENK